MKKDQSPNVTARAMRHLPETPPHLAQRNPLFGVGTMCGRVTLTLAVVLGCLACGPRVLGQSTTQPPAADNVRFGYVDIYVDTHGKPLAAYQLELKATASVKIVGIEGGEAAAFREPPYYDPAALMNDRVILAAFNTGSDLPAGKTRVARVHVRIAGGAVPEYSISMQVAADASGKPIAATASWTEGVGR
jgi:hypothetical protein